jgi:MOSC domain-containing protein
MNELRVRGLNRFPVKSCRGEQLTRALVEPWGLAGDRRWMIVDSDGVLVTAREYPRLVLARPQLTEVGLRLTHPDLDPIDVATPAGAAVGVVIWRSALGAVPAADDAHAWFSAIVGKPVRLVYLADPTQRPTNPLYSKTSDRVSLADGYPLLLTTEASLDALNALIATGSHAKEAPLPMIRFRPSVVVAGSPTAWAEDGWRRLRIGAAVFRVVKGCDRCVLTTIHPDTAVKGREPLATLARHRRWDGKTWFGVQLIPDTPGAEVAVGDEVEVLDAVDATDGPIR